MQLKQILRFNEYDFSDEFLFSVLDAIANTGDPRHLNEVVEIEEFLENQGGILSPETVKYVHSFKNFILKEWQILLEDEIYDREM